MVFLTFNKSLWGKFILASFLLAPIFVGAQTWEQAKSTPRNEKYPFVLNRNGDILLTFFEPGSINSRITIQTLDQNGQLLNEQSFNPKQNFEYTYISKPTVVEDTIYFLGMINDLTTSEVSLTFIKFNLITGNLLQKIHPITDTVDYFFDYTFTGDGIIVPGWSTTQVPGQLISFLKEFDLNGKLITQQYFDNNVFSTGYLWGTNINKYSARSVNHFDFRFNRSNFSAIDTVVTSVNNASFGGVVTSIHDNKTHYLSGRYADTIPGTIFKCEVLKAVNDSILTKIFRFGKAGMQNVMQGVVPVAELDTNILYMVGTSAQQIDLWFSEDPAEIALFKTNQNGDTLFLKFYKGKVKYIANSIIATPDGGALIASMKYDWNSPYPYQWDIHLLKVDSLGNYTPLGTPNISKPEELNALVYPNPATNQISITGDLKFPAMVTIYDMLGKELKNVTLYTNDDVVDISPLNSGTYLFRINSNNKLARGRFVVE